MFSQPTYRSLNLVIEQARTVELNRASGGRPSAQNAHNTALWTTAHGVKSIAANTTEVGQAGYGGGKRTSPSILPLIAEVAGVVLMRCSSIPVANSLSSLPLSSLTVEKLKDHAC